ncbi:MAG: TetR/AcrR family transcriptional regulator [Microbacteriaceae bacterium]|nr:TetR/AcrR family transcriptional regulator [Microbacteriaceae bacterium]
MTPNYLPQPLSIDPICAAALRCFTVSGFHGTSIRQIAAEAGLSVPGIYHHFPSKAAILVALCDIAMDGLLAASHESLQRGTTTLERFEHLVGCLIQFHAEYGDIAFVTYSEIRSLPEGAREKHLEQRREEQALVTEVVERGVSEGLFTTPHPRESARAISTLCLGVSQWYRPSGPMPVNELVRVYLDICKDTVRIVR